MASTEYSPHAEPRPSETIAPVVPIRPELVRERAIADTIEYRPDGANPNGRVVEIPAYTSSPEFTDPEMVPIVLFLGYGESSYSTKAATTIISEMTGAPVIAPDLKFNHSDNKDELEKSVVGNFLATIKHINEKLGRPADAPVDVITHSQGGAVLAKSIEELKKGPNYKDPVRLLEEVSPAGFNGEKLGETARKQTKNFFKRLGKNVTHADQIPFNLPFGKFKRDGEKGYKGNLKLANSIGAIVLSDFVNRRLLKKMGIGFGLDSKKSVQYINEREAEGKPTLIYAGEKDPVMKPEEYRDALGINSKSLEIIPEASHSGSGTPAGDAQIMNAAYHLMEARDTLGWEKPTEPEKTAA